MAKNVYIAETRRHAGMTSICLGLISAFQETLGNIGFIKPVGLRGQQVGSYSVDPDIVLIEKACRIHCGLKDMSPITVRRGYPQEEMLRMNSKQLEEQVRAAYDRVAMGKDLVVIEGSGHAAIGSLLKLSNARVAALFDAPVILVSGASSTNPLADVFLNKAFYEKHGAKVIGVILNRVPSDTPQLLRLYAIDALAREGIPLLGILPYQKDLERPEMTQVLEALEGRVLNGAANLATKVGRVVVGAMSPQKALRHLLEGVGEDLMMITASDRTDLITTAVSVGAVNGEGRGLAGLVLTGGEEPDSNVMELLSRTRVPVILVTEDTYTTASRVNQMDVKINPADTTKIESVKSLVKKNVDVGAILELIGS